MRSDMIGFYGLAILWAYKIASLLFQRVIKSTTTDADDQLQNMTCSVSFSSGKNQTEINWQHNDFCVNEQYIYLSEIKYLLLFHRGWYLSFGMASVEFDWNISNTKEIGIFSGRAYETKLAPYHTMDVHLRMSVLRNCSNGFGLMGFYCAYYFDPLVAMSSCISIKICCGSCVLSGFIRKM